MIATPADYQDVQNELIAEIHTTALWPVFVTVDGNIRIPEESDFIDRDGSYIILVTDGIIKSFQVEFNGLAEGRSNKFTRIWNSESRYFSRWSKTVPNVPINGHV